MKVIVPGLLALLLTPAMQAQNVFDPNDIVYTYNSGSPAGSPTNPNLPPANTIAKWVRTVRRISWDATKFKCYYFNGMAFRLRFPNNYNPASTTKYPLVIFYHGGGEIGPVTDNEDQLFWGAQLFEQRINAGEWNGFLFFPQQTHVGWDDSYFSRVNLMLDTLRKYNNFDPARVITMGLSSGGYGATAHALMYPQRVASSVPSCPEAVRTLDGNINNGLHIPLWISNGGLDLNPDPWSASAFISSFRGSGGNCYQTYLADEGHLTWNLQWGLTNSSGKHILSDWWNSAHKAQPLVFYGNDHFCTGSVNTRLGITAGFAAYEWQFDNGGGFVTIGGAGSNEYQATQAGKYRVRFQYSANSAWSDWTPNPVVITEKACTADTLLTERFEEASPYYYAASAYKPGTFDCQNGVFTSSTYNITQDATGKTGGEFLLNNTAGSSGCTYTGNDQVWQAFNVVNVAPNTNYQFCFYLANRSTSNNAKIVPIVNGTVLTAGFAQAAGSGNSSWTKFSYTWNSGDNSAAYLSLNNLVAATSGNDFALDEISFSTTATVPINQPPVANAGTSVTLTLPNNSTSLNGSASTDPDGSIVSYAWTKFSGPAAYTIANASAVTTQVSNLTAGIYVFRLQVTDNSGATATDTVTVTVNSAPACGPLPSGVSTIDVGGNGSHGGIAVGSACFIPPGTYDIKGAGDLTSRSDKFRFVYRSFSGNGTMIVKVTSQDAVSSLNKAGLMFRESLSSGANYAFIGLTSGNGVYLQSQTTQGVSTTTTGAGVIKAPYYLRLVRSGSGFTGSVSADSVRWTTIGTKTVSMSATTIYMGLFVCSHNNNNLSEAFFNNWTILDGSGMQINARAVTGMPVAETAAGVQPVTNSALKIYPNPARGSFVVDFSVERKQDVWLSVIAADGRICYTERLIRFSGHYHKDFGYLPLAQGNYAITMHSETGVKTVVLIKE